MTWVGAPAASRRSPSCPTCRAPRSATPSRAGDVDAVRGLVPARGPRSHRRPGALRRAEAASEAERMHVESVYVFGAGKVGRGLAAGARAPRART